jgi:hypothetical protein
VPTRSLTLAAALFTIATPALAQSILFDFDNAPIHTSLPVDVAAGGINAHLSACFYGLSIQPANSMGFTPPGFSGLCIYPNTVFACDLTIDFSSVLTDFSILYSPQELGCDDSARMRVTVYLDGAYVATNTTTCPNPGTWPSTTLAISAPAGFNRAVVHYDQRPPTCSDYGVIFLADNMRVTPKACTAPSISQPPVDTSTCPSGLAWFEVSASGSGTLTYEWQRETSPGSNQFIQLLNGPTSAWDGNSPGIGAIVSGASTATMTIEADTAAGRSLSPAHAIRYRCRITNACGNTASTPARLTVCAADFNCDSQADFFDYLDFAVAFDAEDPAADVNHDAQVDFFDYLDFVLSMDAGC